jgi:hypothetical protein
MATSSNALLDLINQRRAAFTRTKTIKPEPGRNRYRVLPSWRLNAEGKRDLFGQFWMDFGQHFLKGDDGKIKAVAICADKTFNKPCDVCQLVAAGIASADNDMLIARLKDAVSSKRILLNVLWRDNGGKCDPNVPQLLEVPVSVLEGKKGAGGLLSLYTEWPNLLNLADGLDVIVEKVGTGKEGTSYSVQIASGSTPVDVSVLDKLHDLDKFVTAEDEQSKQRALTTLHSMGGISLPAPVVQPQLAAPGMIAPSNPLGGPSTIEGTATVVAPAAPAAAPAAPAAVAPAPAAVAPVAAAPAAPAATTTTTGDPALDALLADI